MGTPLRVLMVEDSGDDAELLLLELERGGYDPVHERVDSQEAMAAALEGRSWDVVISDYVMPQFSGLAALALLKEMEIDLPFIIVSGRIGEDIAVEAMKAGAHDYLRKDNLARLVPAVGRELREAVVRRERKLAQEALLRAHEELERRVEERTEELRASNEALHIEIGERRRAEEERERLVVQLRETNEELVAATMEAREQADEAWRRAAELNATIGAIADGLIIYGPAAEIVHMNHAAENLLGYSRSERGSTLAKRLEALKAETADGQPFKPDETPVMYALRGETVCAVTMVLHPARGKIWVSFSAAPVRSPEGTIVGAVATFTDVTAVHELQEQREDFIRSISHDLRSPLAIIQGQASILQRTLGKGGQRGRSLGYIIAASHRMNAMIRDLVDSARQESGQLALEKQTVELRPFVCDLLEKYALMMSERRVKVEVAADLPPVDADPGRLERIFLNLIGNAMKYAPPESEVIVGARAANGEVVTSVADKGLGIAPEDLPRIFDRYYRARGDRKDEGLGLGLYITRMLVEAHGGAVSAHSKVGEGTTFYFTLPLA